MVSCRSAWKRAYDAYLEGKKGSGIDQMFAAHQAGPAYCGAMPPLDDYESIRSFIACVAHGILIEAIPQKRANQLLYAAQVAYGMSLRQPASQKRTSAA